MKHNLLWKVISLLVVTSFILVACGTPATEAPAPTKAATEAPAQVATEAPAEAATEAPMNEVNLRWRTRPDNQEEIDVYSNISGELDAELEGITLTYEPGGTEGANYQDQLRSEVAAGTAPDVFWIPGTDVADFATRGLILNISDLAANTESFDTNAFYPGPMYHLTYNPESATSGADSGALWGLPRDVSTFALYLNMDLINEAGAPDPRELAANGEWDWDAFLDVAQKTRALGTDVYGYGASAWWGPYGVWLNASGGGFFNEDRTACALNTPESLAGLEFQRSLYQDFDVATPYGEDPEPTFRAGKVAMFQNGRWATPGVRTVDFEWDVVELPKGPNGTPGNWLFWGAYVINAKTEHPEEAWKVIEFLTSEEGQAPIVEFMEDAPANIAVLNSDAFLNQSWSDKPINMAALGEAADSAFTLPLSPKWNEMNTIFDTNLGEVFANRAEVQATMDAIQAQLVELFSQ